MKTVYEKLQELERKFNARAERARNVPRLRETDWAYLDSVSIYRWNEENDKGEALELSNILVDFNFYRSGRDHWSIYNEFEKKVNGLGLRLVPNGNQTTEIGGGNCYRIEI